ncbi:MAG: uroporphyrinogen decarboxylase family protein, partial [Armatimonadota bacterium]|nr:uroporphyrinogen decarboxylase family protein [Armatimonadota bacterium]
MYDEWGNEWRRLESITKGEVHHGVLQDSWDLLETYEFPRTHDPALYERARAECAEHHAQGYYVLGSVGWPFNIARYLRRMENFLADVAAEPERVEDLLWRITRLLEREILRLADAGVDGIMSGEDWGTQDRLLVSPATWRRLFKPCFRHLCAAAHSRGLSVWLHSCGHVSEVLEDWVEVGIDVCQFDQPELHGIDFLAEHFGGRMHFWCPVDIQHTLPTRDPQRIEQAAREYVEKLGGFGGGFVAGYYGSNEALGLDPEYQAIASRAFMRYGNPAPRGVPPHTYAGRKVTHG